MSFSIDMSRASVVFISYDEPEADQNFATLQAVVPRALRVHGVKGFDAAHRRAGDISTTPHVVTVDGDNVVTDPGFFGQTLSFPADHAAAVVSFGAVLAHNGLTYGNGGVKIWPRHLIRTLRAHEHARDGQTSVDFCFRVPYVQAARAPTTTVVASAPKHAFRAGLREGSRLLLTRGQVLRDVYPDLPPAEALRAGIGRSGIDRLKIWCSVGRHVSNGDWAILGARTGACLALDPAFDIHRISDYDWIDRLWDTEVSTAFATAAARTKEIRRLGAILTDTLDLEIADLSKDGSRFAMSIYRSPRRLGAIMPD